MKSKKRTNKKKKINIIESKTNYQEEIREKSFTILESMKDEIIIKDLTILEVGIGNCNFIDYIYKLELENNYIGFDIDEDIINKARELYPLINFIQDDIIKDKNNILKKIDIFCSFQCLEHVGTEDGDEDINVISRLNKDTKILVSIPNFESKTHVRWFELDGWINRYADIIDYKECKILNSPKYDFKRTFFIYGIRK